MQDKHTVGIIVLILFSISISLWVWLLIRLHNQNKRQEKRDQFMLDINKRLFEAKKLNNVSEED